MPALRLSELHEFREFELRVCSNMILTMIRVNVASVARGTPALMRAGYTATEISRHAKTIDTYFGEHAPSPSHARRVIEARITRPAA